MFFNSYMFMFVFLPITFFIYYYLNSRKLITIAKAFLVLSSLFFYSWWNINYLPIIISSILFNYGIGMFLSKDINHKKINKRIVLTLGVSLNIILLIYFKYTNFLIENLNTVINGDFSLVRISLPLAISFFTFQQIAYLVDSYRHETEEYNFLNYVLFVTFFPQLIAGPIVHHTEMMPQFMKLKHKIINYKNIIMGLFMFSIGLFKKVVIADSFSVWATQGFDVAQTLNFFEAWATSLSYTFQLYFDFSGYTDMAIGAALLFNITLPINFNSPYKATSIQDFWRRWHITLSRFLKEYVYIPLGGNKKGTLRTYSNLIATFVIGGIWHGAGWTFLFWGFLHGLALVIQKVWTALGLGLHNILAWFITFNFINIAWIFFRAKEWKDATKVLDGMFNINGNHIGYTKTFIDIYNQTVHKLSFFMPKLEIVSQIHMFFDFRTYFWICIVFIIVVTGTNSQQLVAKVDTLCRTSQKIFILLFFSIMFVYSIIHMSLYKYTEFIYFNF